MLPTGPRSSDKWYLELGAWLFAFAVVLVPVWSVHYLATTDGGAHLANADVVRHFVSGGSGAYANFYQLNPRPVPNWLGHFILAILLTFAKPAVAEKILMSMILVLLPLAVRYAVTGVKRSAGFLALLAVPLSLNCLVMLGFYNFSASVVVFFFALGYWLRHRENMNAARALILLAFGFLLYAGHLSSILLFAATVAINAIWFTFARICRARRLVWGHATSRLIITGVALLPAVALAVWFQHRGFDDKPPGFKLAIKDVRYWKDLLQLSILVSYHARPEKWIGRGLVLVIAALLIGVAIRKFRHGTWLRRDGLIFAPLALVCLYFLEGSIAHQQLFIPQRLTLYTALLLLIFLAAQSYSTAARYGVMIASLLLTVSLSATHWRPMHEFDAQLQEYIGIGDRIEPHTTFLSLVFAPRGLPMAADPPSAGLRVAPFFTAQGYVAVDRQAIDLRNYEAGYDYFPVKFRPEVDPFKLLARPDMKNKGANGLRFAVPQVVDIPAYEAASHKHVDYVLMFGQQAMRQQDQPIAAPTLDHIHAAYDLVYRSPNGRTELWHRKPTVR